MYIPFIMQTVGIKKHPSITNLNTLRSNDDKNALFCFTVRENDQTLLLTKVDRYITKSHHFVFVCDGAKIQTNDSIYKFVSLDRNVRCGFIELKSQPQLSDAL